MNIPMNTTQTLDGALDALVENAEAALVPPSCVTSSGPLDGVMPISTSNTICNINSLQGLNNAGVTVSNDMRFPLQFSDGALSRVFTFAPTSVASAAGSPGAITPGSGAGMSVLHARNDKNGVPGFVTLHLKHNKNADLALGASSIKKSSTAKSQRSQRDSTCAQPCAESDSLLDQLGQDVMHTITELPETPFYRNVVVVAVVFFVFLMVELLMLCRSDSAVSMQLSVRLTENEQMLTLASRLTSRLFDAVEIARAAGALDEGVQNHSLQDDVIFVLARVKRRLKQIHGKDAVEEAADELSCAHHLQAKVDRLRVMCDDAIHTLHNCISYQGPEEDLRFLIEKHVLYERNMKEMAAEEMRWLYAAIDTQHRRQAVTASIGANYVPPIKYRACTDKANCEQSAAETSRAVAAAQKKARSSNTGWWGSRARAKRSNTQSGRQSFSEITHRLHERALLLSHRRTSTQTTQITQSTLIGSVRTSTVDPLSQAYLRGTLTNAEVESAMRTVQKSRLIRRALSNKIILLLLTYILLHLFFKLG